MMKTTMTALAVLLLVQAGPALADQSGRGGERAERAREDMDRPQRDWRGPRPRPQASRAPEAPRAPEAASPPQAAEPRWGNAGQARGRVRGDSVGRPGPWVQGGAQPSSVDERGGHRERRAEGRRPADQRGDADQRADGRRGDGDGAGDRRQAPTYRDGDGRTWTRREGDRGWTRPDGDGRDWSHHERRGGWDRDHRSDHRSDGRHHRRHDGHPRWERGRYPSVYVSSYRYYHSWRAPAGYYVRAWGFGDFLPLGWYGPNWWIVDFWAYDLPEPPPGYEWVRVGGDALLVEQYTGRVVQVVRDVFW